MKKFLFSGIACICAILIIVPEYAFAQGLSGTYMCAKENAGGFRFNANATVSMLDSSGKMMVTLRYQLKDKLITIYGPHADIKLPVLANGDLEYRDGSQAALICRKKN